MSIPTLTSHADFEHLLVQPENRDRRLELINGEIVEKTGTFLHGLIIFNIGFALRLYFQITKIGKISTDGRFMADPDNDFRPDISIVMAGTPIVRQGAMPGVPDIAIEVQSQSVNYMRERATHYLSLGIKMIWLVYPKKRLVEVITAENIDYFVDVERISAEPLLPGFSMAVKDVFEEL